MDDHHHTGDAVVFNRAVLGIFLLLFYVSNSKEQASEKAISFWTTV